MSGYTQYGVSPVSGAAIAQAIPIVTFPVPPSITASYYFNQPFQDGEHFLVGANYFANAATGVVEDTSTLYHPLLDISGWGSEIFGENAGEPHVVVFGNSYVTVGNMVGAHNVMPFYIYKNGDRKSYFNGNLYGNSAAATANTTMAGLFQRVSKTGQLIAASAYSGSYDASNGLYSDYWNSGSMGIGAPFFDETGTRFAMSVYSTTRLNPNSVYNFLDFGKNGQGYFPVGQCWPLGGPYPPYVNGQFPPHALPNSLQSRIFNQAMMAPDSIVQSANGWWSPAYFYNYNGNMPYFFYFILGLNCCIALCCPNSDSNGPMTYIDILRDQPIPLALASDLYAIAANISNAAIAGGINITQGGQYQMGQGGLAYLNCLTYTGDGGYVLCSTPNWGSKGLQSHVYPNSDSTPNNKIFTLFANNISYPVTGTFTEPVVTIYKKNNEFFRITPRLLFSYPGYQYSPSLLPVNWPNLPLSMWCSPRTGRIYAVYNSPNLNEYMTTELGFARSTFGLCANFNWKD